MPDAATIDITQGASPDPLTNLGAPADYGPFADLINSPTSDTEAATSPQLIGGGTPAAPAFQTVNGRTSDVPIGVAVSTTDYGPFSDLVDTGPTMAPSDVTTEQFGMFSDLVPKSPTSEMEKAVSETPGYDVRAALSPEWARNAAQGLYDTISGLIPKSPLEALGMFTPVVGAAETTKKVYGALRDWLGGKSIAEADLANFPEAQVLVQADKTPPFSRERFTAGFGMLAQMGMLALGGRGLVHGEPSAAVESPEAPSTPVSPEPSSIPLAASPADLAAGSPLGLDTVTTGTPSSVPSPLESAPANEAVRTPAQGDTTTEPTAVQPIITPDNPFADLVPPEATTEGEPNGSISQPQPEGQVLRAGETGQNVESDTGQVGVGNAQGQETAGTNQAEEAPIEFLPPEEEALLPKLRSGEKGTAELFQGQDQPFNLSGETGIDYEARARAADEKAQEEQARRAHEAEMQQELQSFGENLGGHVELMDAIKDAGGMPAKGSPRYVGEMDNIISMIRDPMRKGKPGYGIAGLLKTDAPHLDELTTRLRDRGFDFETPDDLVNAVEARLRTGHKLYGNAERAAAMSGMGNAPVVGAPPLGIRGFGPGAASEAEGLAKPAIRERLRNWLFAGRDPEEAKANYSGLGAARTFLGQGLRETEKANENIYLAARRTAASAAQARNILNDAAGAVKRDLGRGQDGWNDFKGVLVESRLRGIRERWDDLSQSMSEATDKELAGEKGEHLVDLLANMRGRIKGEDPLAAGIALRQAKDYKGLRQFLSDTFAQARDRVGRIALPKPFEEMAADPKFQKGLATYKSLVEKPLAENHALNEGVFSDALGPLDTYFPLTAASQVEEGAAGRKGYGGRLLPFRRPMNARNKFATGLSPRYDLGDEPLHKAVAIAVRMNNTAALLDTLSSEGFIKKLKPTEPGESEIEVGGVNYQASTVPIGPQRLTKDKFGRTAVIPQQKALVPIWLANELRPVLESAKFTKYDVINLLDKINGYAISGPLDAVFHTANVIGSITSGTPWAGTDLISKTIGNTPVAKIFTTIANLSRIDPKSPESIAAIQEMAKLGVIPTRYSNTVTTKGLFGRFLFGTKGLDIRGRLLAYDIYNDLIGRKPGEPLTNQQKLGMIKFVDQLGNYVPQLSGKVETYLKANRIAPFYEAGKQMYINGIKSVLGTTPLPPEVNTLGGKFGARLAQQIGGGLVGVAGTWAVTYRAYTGQWPWEDKRARLLEIPLNDEDRKSALAQHLFGPGDRTAYVSFGFFNPLSMRGTTALGIRGLANEVALDPKLAGVGIEDGMRDAINSFLHPVTSSPILRAGTVAIAGVEPQISSLRDSTTGKPGVSFYNRTNRKEPGLPQIAENVKQGALELNTFVRNIADGTGLGQESYHPVNEADQSLGDHALRMAVDTVFPRLLGSTTDVDAKTKRELRNLKASESHATGFFGGSQEDDSGGITTSSPALRAGKVR